MTEQPARDRIKRAAMQLFVAHGVDAVSMRDIADAAGMKAPSLYAHFKSREALVSEMFLTGYAEYGHRLADAAATPGRFHDKLDAMIRLICWLHAEDATLFNFLLVTQHGNLRDLPVDGDSNPVEVLCRAVAEAMDRGEIPRREPNVIAAALMGVMIQAATFMLYGRLTKGFVELQGEIVGIAHRIVS